MSETNRSPLKAVMGFLESRKNFTLADLVKASGIERGRILRVLEKLRNEGYLELLEESLVMPKGKEVGPPRRNPKYRLVKDVAMRAPKRPECARDKIWRTIRHLRKASRTDLVRISGCSETSVEKFTLHLANHGFIKPVGRRGKEKLWFLVKDTGPKKPQINDD